jgi:hypothetical protein
MIEPPACRVYRLAMRSALTFYEYPKSEQGTAITAHEVESLLDFMRERFDPAWAPKDLVWDAASEPLYTPEARQYLNAYVTKHGIAVEAPSPCWPLFDGRD